MLHITLSKAFDVDPRVDELGRVRVGFDPNMTEAELHEANRGCWVLGKRADRERFAVFSHHRTVVQAMEITGILNLGRRRALEGRVLHQGDPVYDEFVGGPSPVSARNPVGYFDHPVGRNVCGCGCGAGIPGSGLFVAGHDQRAIHERIAKIGTVRDFIEWFDRTWTDGD